MTPTCSEEGTAFGIIVLAALLLVGTVMILSLTPAMNMFVGVFNTQVDAETGAGVQHSNRGTEREEISIRGVRKHLRGDIL